MSFLQELRSLIEQTAPALFKEAAPYLIQAIGAALQGDENAAAKHIRIGAQKVAAKRALRAKRAR